MELSKQQLEEEFFAEKVKDLKQLVVKLSELESSKEEVTAFTKPIMSVCGTFNR